MLYIVGTLLGGAMIQIVGILQIAAARICANNISGHYDIDHLILFL